MKEKIKMALIKLEPELKRLAKLIEDAENEGVYGDTPQEHYLRSMNNKIGSKLDDARRLLRQVNAPVIEEGTLRKNASGRYELPSGDYFTSGSSIEFLHSYSDGDQIWVYSSVEHNGEDYYITNIPDTPMAGLRVRVKQLPLWD
ncbi:DUF5348 domain-containing protein [Paenibacillus sp. DMB5]|uniref:DUF5348 domain-containing protein n=1 Tax=Paenibacillus sp. DMB5 TaxID=1780103 RepID=UPI00076C1245|nr:DUF5348 domain-containing protein [Paenibacillus sp. DMB5]KUP22383.1 hypothetical protein AWJ19_27580 [Paenibacillus sp. DMB5]